ncbi:MAG: hypothetical protein LBH12_03835, partial [Dysgonamonadaceae bacterium]|nr:hypothetical protein [Dysgonamonadaceae bacterium]
SFSAAVGGFDALLVGLVDSGSRGGFGTGADFWSSSSNSGTDAWGRYLRYDYDRPGVDRGNNRWSVLFSVRCKKD